MSSEVKIINLDPRKIKTKEVEQDAKDMLIVKAHDINTSVQELSQTLFENKPIMYIYPTERLMINRILETDEPFATVLAGGDFALDSIYRGIREVLTFDINRKQVFPTNLKLACLQNLEYSEFYDFLMDVDSPNFLSYERFTSIKRKLQNDSRLFTFFDIILIYLSPIRV